jgi:hypothetical protein
MPDPWNYFLSPAVWTVPWISEAATPCLGRRVVQAESARNPESDGTLNFGAIMSESLYDDMVIAVSKSLSVGSILASSTWHVPTAICTLSLEYSLRGADGNFRVSASPLPAPS